MSRTPQPLLLFLVVVLVLVLVPLPGSPPGPAEAGGAVGLIRAALQAGGDNLAALQNADGGWFFTVGDADCGLGAGVSCANTFGVTALGLVASFRMTRDPDHRAAVHAAADALVAKQAAALVCDSNPATGADRPFTVDATFLMEAAKVAGNDGLARDYRRAARSWFTCVELDFPGGAGRADNRIDGRIGQGLDNLGEWDACLDIGAALALGHRAYAEAEALQVIARQADWDVADPQCPGCQWLGKGLCSEVMRPLGENAAIRNAVAAWTVDLLAAQDPDGSWGQDTQTTAYVVMGLHAQPRTKAVGTAIARGTLFLLSQAIGTGGYFVCDGCPDEITEVDSEVLQALWAIR
jgi:hypothetical protein